MRPLGKGDSMVSPVLIILFKNEQKKHKKKGQLFPKIKLVIGTTVSPLIVQPYFSLNQFYDDYVPNC